MKRVRADSLGRVTDDELINTLLKHESFLCIVNTRPHAARLYESFQLTGGQQAYHLSTLMTGHHRSIVLKTIRRRLHQGRSCRVFATQLIEAGVDIDFPVVFRALCGLDSIAQAAGRCTVKPTAMGAPLRLRTEGRVVAWLPEGHEETGAEIASMYSDVLSPEAIEHYFRLHYWKQSDRWDENQVMSCFVDPGKLVFQYRSAAERFRMISEKGHTVFVPFGRSAIEIEGKIRSREFRETPSIQRRVLRSASVTWLRFTKAVYDSLLGTDIELVHDHIPVLSNMTLYDHRLDSVQVAPDNMNQRR